MSPRHIRWILFPALGVLFVGSVLGQSKGSTAPPAGSTGNTGAAGGTTGTRGTLPTNTPNNNTTTTSPTIPRPIFLTGHVAIDDGSPLPEPATILRVCNGNPHTEGYTDSSGNFGIELGNDRNVLQDASETSGYGMGSPGGGMSGGMPGAASGSSGGTNSAAANNGGLGDRRLNNCELQARLAGFRSQSVMLVNRQSLDDPNIGTILLHRNVKGEEGNTVSAKSLAAPKDARKAFDKGLELTKKGKVDDAFREFQKAVMLYPAYATAWCELGKIEVARGQADIARGSFNEALKSDPKYVDPYLQLSLLALNSKNWPEVAEFTGKALELDSFDYPQEYLFDAVAHYNMHEFDRAEKSILRAESLDTRHQFPQIAYLKGLVLLQHHDYAAAAENLRTYLKLSPNADDATKVREQLAQIDKYLAQSSAKQPQ